MIKIAKRIIVTPTRCPDLPAKFFRERVGYSQISEAPSNKTTTSSRRPPCCQSDANCVAGSLAWEERAAYRQRGNEPPRFKSCPLLAHSGQSGYARVCLLLDQSGQVGRHLAEERRLLFVTLASLRAWAACRAAKIPRGGVTPPTLRWPALGSAGRRSCRWQR
jgi:hypothetical protein